VAFSSRRRECETFDARKLARLALEGGWHYASEPLRRRMVRKEMGRKWAIEQSLTIVPKLIE
jgi:hypothetical protein